VERLPESVETRPHLPGCRDLEQPVDGDHARGGFHEVRIDEGAVVRRREAVDDLVGCHNFSFRLSRSSG
jgi:hypothetical protein